MRAVLVDDELHALDELSYYLKKYNVEILGAFTLPEEAYEFIMNIQPDVVFLDIDMYQYSGLELGVSINRHFPTISIVYVTAHPQYALDAYKSYPIDYILKPIDEQRLSGTIEHIREKTTDDSVNPPTAPVIKCFGKFEILSGKHEVKFPTQKSRELLAYLLCHTNHAIYRGDLVSIIFDTGDDRKDSNNFRVTVHRLRQAFKDAEIDKEYLLIRDDFTIRVAYGVCDIVDFQEFVHKNLMINEKNIDEAERIVETIDGDLFSDIDTEWLAEIREFVTAQAEELILKTAIYFVEKKKVLKAELYLKKLIQMNPLSEQGHISVLDLCIETNNKGKYIYYYKRYSKMLEEEFDCKPSKKYADIFERYST